MTALFQSTLPAWGETRWKLGEKIGVSISIHSPRMGRDAGCRTAVGRIQDFNPLSPHGERPSGQRADCQSLLISIHSPRMGRDLNQPFLGARPIHFNPLSPHGERHKLRKN